MGATIYIFFVPFSLFVILYAYVSVCDFVCIALLLPFVLRFCLSFFLVFFSVCLLFSILFSACYDWWISFLVWLCFLSFFLFNYF